MKNLLLLILIAAFCSCTKTNNINPTKDSQVLILDTVYHHNNYDFKIKISQREDYRSRKIGSTYQCENNGLISYYGNEYVVDIIKYRQKEKLDSIRNYANTEVMETLIKSSGKYRSYLEGNLVLTQFIAPPLALVCNECRQRLADKRK